MKTKSFFCVLSIFCLLLAGCMPTKMVQGNGDVVSKEINVADYSRIEVYGGGVLEFNYKRMDAVPYLSVSTDKNIFDIMEIKVSGDKLVIRPKDRNMNIKPTRLDITANSRDLSKVNVCGGGNFYVNSTLVSPELSLEIAGSGFIHLKDVATVDEVDTDIAGSGTIQIDHLVAKKIDSDIAGSGTIIMNGVCKSGFFDIAGSGKVKALECQFEDVSNEIAGSGNIEISVSKVLKNNIAGSGDVRYRGNANVQNKIAGRGNVNQLD